MAIPSGTSNSGKGNHNMSTGDMDKDGFDELVIGAMAVDHDGSILWVKNGQDGQDFAGHADSIHLAAMNPNKNDLYVFTPAEEQNSTLNYSLVNAKTGTRWIGEWFTKKDVGRGVAANITPLPGYESWAAASGSGLYAFDGTLISTAKNVPMNWVIYWDGDLLSELADGAGTEGNMKITKYNWETDTCDNVAQFSGTKMCNWTKNTPSLTADILGDWREEVIMRNTDDTELRIYMTTIETDYMIYTLMHDPVYRNSVANQNTSYNQPTHVGIYLGEDSRDVVLNMQLDTANVKYAVEVEEEGTDIPDRPVISDDYFADDNNIADAEDSWKGEEGWQKINGDWYYFSENGKAHTGWVEDKDGEWYYMNKDGKMATEWVQSPDSKLWYYMDATNGNMLSNDWFCDPKSNRWYYLDPNGAMCTGWILLDNAWYLLDKSGAMCTGWNLVNGKWYLLGQNGAMLTGWQEVAGKFYYMVESGECLMNTTTPDGRKVDKNGARVD